MTVTEQTATQGPVERYGTRRSPALAALVMLGPLLLLASELVAVRWPDGLSDRETAAFRLAHVDRFTLSYLLGTAAAAALVGSYVVTAFRIRDRGRRVAVTAAVLGVIGSIGVAGHMAVLMARRDLIVSDPEAWHARAEVGNGVTEAVTMLPVVVGVELGIVLLAVAVRRAGWAGRWVVLAGTLAVVADFSPTSWNTVLYAGFASLVFGVAAAHVGWPRRRVA